MFRGIKQQIINNMMLELDEHNYILEWFIEDTMIPKTVHSKMTLKSILDDAYFEEVSNLIVKSIIYGRSAAICIPVGKGIHATEYDLMVIPREAHTIIDIKRIT